MIYDQHYFEDDENGVTHPAGYSNYSTLWPDTREQNLDFIAANGLVQKEMLELGGAYGFFLDAMAEASGNIYCTSVDGSEWAASQHPLVIHTDALTYLQGIGNNAFEVIVGLRFLPCLTDEQLEAILPHILRVAPQRLFVVDDLGFYQSGGFDIEKLSQYYNVKTLEAWQTLMTGCIVSSIADPIWRVK